MLLSTSKYYLLVFQNLSAAEKAANTDMTIASCGRSGHAVAEYWRNRLKDANIWSALPNDIFLVIETIERNGCKFHYVVHRERLGYIRTDDWLGLNVIRQ